MEKKICSGAGGKLTISEIFFPTQVLLPAPKVNKYFSISLFLASLSNHRSGLNKSASSPNTPLSRCTTCAFIPTCTPSGKYSPQIVAPPLGGYRGMQRETEGQIRRASETTAWK